MFLSGDSTVQNWGCSVCKGDEYHEGDDMRSLRNCDGSSGRSDLAFEWMPSLRQCPWSLIDPAVSEILKWWTEWKSFALLPWHGTISEQPAFVVEVIQMCERLKAEIDSAANETHTQQLSRGK